MTRNWENHCCGISVYNFRRRTEPVPERETQTQPEPRMEGNETVRTGTAKESSGNDHYST